jgi:hypothetical protein
MRRKKANFSKTTTLTITILDGFLSRVNGPDQTHTRATEKLPSCWKRHEDFHRK